MKNLLIKLATSFLHRCGYTVAPKAQPIDYNIPAFLRNPETREAFYKKWGKQ